MCDTTSVSNAISGVSTGCSTPSSPYRRVNGSPPGRPRRPGSGRYNMRRPALVTIIVLGSVVTLVGATGIYAEFTDRATTGTNTATSGERPRAADLAQAQV